MSTIATLNRAAASEPALSLQNRARLDVRLLDPNEVEAVVVWAKSCKLKVIDVDAGKRRVQVEGSVAAINKAFGVQLESDYRHPRRIRASRARGPGTCAGGRYTASSRAMLGLDTRRVGRPRLRRAAVEGVDWAKASPSHGHRSSRGHRGRESLAGHLLSACQVAALYNYPSNLTGSWPKCRDHKFVQWRA